MELLTDSPFHEQKTSIRTLLASFCVLFAVKAKGFTMEILSRIPEVKDTVQKHSLLHHLVQMVTEQYSDSNDLFSDLGAVNRCAKVRSVIFSFFPYYLIS